MLPLNPNTKKGFSKTLLVAISSEKSYANVTSVLVCAQVRQITFAGPGDPSPVGKLHSDPPFSNSELSDGQAWQAHLGYGTLWAELSDGAYLSPKADSDSQTQGLL